MRGTLLLTSFAAFVQITFALRNGTVPVYYSKSANSSAHVYKSRQGKFLPFYTVVRFKNTQCSGTNGLLGTCYLRSECRSKQGVAFGSCSRGLGVCCVVTRNCGGLPTSSNNTYFRNPGFPDTYAGGAACTISIAKNRDSVTHVRLSFVEFTLAQPAATGVCTDDRFSVLGTDSNPPTLCGDNNGQHIYLKFLPDSSAMQITIATAVANTFRRRWNILVTQHEQNQAPPPGCLMYFPESSGQIKSFNYEPTATVTGARELANLNYIACIRTAAGYCSAEWRRVNGDNPFSVSGATNAGPLSGATCATDYVIIPNALVGQTSADRYCASMMPFMLGVVTNGDETGDTSNRGFNLQYTQILCQ